MRSRLPNTNAIVGTILDGLLKSSVTVMPEAIDNSLADECLGKTLADHLLVGIDNEFNEQSLHNVVPDVAYGDVIMSLRNDMHVEQVIEEFPCRGKKADVCVFDLEGDALAVVQALYDWRSQDTAEILDGLESLQYLSGLPLAVLAIALPLEGSDCRQTKEDIRREIDEKFGPYSGRLSGYVNPVVTFTGWRPAVGNSAHHWCDGKYITGYVGCCVYYPFGETGVPSPFKKMDSPTSPVH